AAGPCHEIAEADLGSSRDRLHEPIARRAEILPPMLAPKRGKAAFDLLQCALIGHVRRAPVRCGRDGGETPLQPALRGRLSPLSRVRPTAAITGALDKMGSGLCQEQRGRAWGAASRIRTAMGLRRPPWRPRPDAPI